MRRFGFDTAAEIRKVWGMKSLLAAVFSLMLAPLVSLAEQPNIVLVMADDQGWGDMAYNGHPVIRTPHFDAMAAEALRFDHFYSAAPVCSPTRASVLTGRHPNRATVFKWGDSLRPQEVTIAEKLGAAGYATGHFGKWHLGSVRKGSPVNPGAQGFDEWLSAENFYDNDAILSREGTAVQLKGESSFLAVDAAIEFIQKQSQANKPFLAVVWFGSPHGPHRAAEEDKALYADQSKKDQDFFGEITGMDRAFGKLRRSIAELGIRDNTILWYTSDNGGLKEESSGGRMKKGSVYEGGLRVPAIIEWPAKIDAPRVTPMMANTVDIFPTLLDIAGVTADDKAVLDGISLLPTIEGSKDRRDQPMGFWDVIGRGGTGMHSDRMMADLLAAQAQGHEPDEPELLRLDAAEIKKQYPLDSFAGHSAWRDGDWKLHRIEDENGRIVWELYNIATDKMEAKDLAGEAGQAGRVKAMKSQLMSWLESVARSMNGEDYP